MFAASSRKWSEQGDVCDGASVAWELLLAPSPQGAARDPLLTTAPNTGLCSRCTDQSCVPVVSKIFPKLSLVETVSVKATQKLSEKVKG